MPLIEPTTLIQTDPIDDEDFTDIPISMMDILNICSDFNQLGYGVQRQINFIAEIDVEEAIKEGYVKQEALPHIKYFLQRITNNVYFGEAVSQAQYCLELIKQYEEKYKVSYDKSN